MAEKRIGQFVYRCEPLTGREPWALLLDVKKVLAPMGSILGISSADGLMDATRLMAGELFNALGAVDDQAVLDLMERLVGMCKVDGAPCVWGVKPQNMSDTFEVVLFVLKVNFESFFNEGPVAKYLKAVAA
ncbi:MAG TPA: hypothetical protein VGU72_25560 [Beijerinckiaceae bacterium]|jgi:hypothetical protein|nr:hypothetical protein [Beijerinckiaceae bacterium]